MAERIKGTPREISFYGEGKSDDIYLGFGITTIRNPRPSYDFARGEVVSANCVDDNDKVQVVVIDEQTKPLRDQDIPVLALDGFFSPEHAAEVMHVYPGYENLTEDSPISAIIFVYDEVFKQLPKTDQKELIEKPFSEIIRDKKFRFLFFPTMLNHLVHMGGSFDDWIDFLSEANGLITKEEADKMRELKIHGRSVADLLRNHHEMFEKIALEPSSSLFEPIVLATGEIKKEA